MRYKLEKGFMGRTLAAAVIFMVFGTAAQAADVIGSAPAHGGTGQAIAVCYYSNLGNASVTFGTSQIYQEPAVVLAESSEFCGGMLPGRQRCRTVANITSAGAALWCRATVSNKEFIRGRLEIRNGSGVVLTSEEVR